MKSRSSMIVLVALAGVAASALAQDYPTKPVRIIAPFAAGGSTDVLTRLVSVKLTERWKQSVIVENRVGASGNIGAEVVAKLSAPDGYTLLMAGAPHTIGVSLFKNLRYDLQKDLVAIANVASFPSLIVVHPSLPAKNVKELIALAKSRPGELNFGSPNIGSPNHLGMELFATMAKVKMVHIPYKGGSGQMVGDLLAGHVQLASMGFPPAIPQVKNGKLRAIAATGAQRSPLLPDVPTVTESGLPGYEVTSWYGLFGPAALPKDIVNKVSADTLAFLNAPDFKERLATLGAEPAPMKPDEFARHVRADIQRWAKVVKESGATAD
jgi:tripartite-type tricarboxylate transporter receptor subunit TctC